MIPIEAFELVSALLLTCVAIIVALCFDIRSLNREINELRPKRDAHGRFTR